MDRLLKLKDFTTYRFTCSCLGHDHPLDVNMDLDFYNECPMLTFQFNTGWWSLWDRIKHGLGFIFQRTLSNQWNDFNLREEDIDPMIEILQEYKKVIDEQTR